MRQLPRTVCAYLVGCLIAAVSVPAFAIDTGFTIDLVAPSEPCVGNSCPADISLPQLAAIATGTDGINMQGTSSTITLDNTVSQPVVCSEVSGANAPYGYGAAGSYQFSPVYKNASPGGLFEVDGTNNASIVDASLVSNNGLTFATIQTNTKPGLPTTHQVACYPVSPLGVTSPLYATGTSAADGDRIFYAPFDGGHFAGEPWVSINTVAAPTDSGHFLGYVMQIHNASSAVSWNLSFGYDQLFFGEHLNGGFPPTWCILAKPQPGPVDTTGALCADATSIHMIKAADIQTATNSIYVYVQNFGTSTAVSAWPTLSNSFFAASGAVFSEPGVYAQRVDDKVSVAGTANIPVQNVGDIVCANDPASTSCTLFDQDGNALPALVTFANQVSTGAVTIDPVAYVVDAVTPLSGITTLPGTRTTLAAPSAVSCVDPNGIFASPISASNFVQSPSASGALKINFNFAPSGALFVAGTATCTATYTSNGLSSRQSFSVTMQQLNVTHFSVTADATATAGTPASFTVTAKDGANNTVASYTGTVKFTSTDGHAMLPANSTLTNGSQTFPVTFETSGAWTITATDTVSSTIHGTSVNSVAVSADVASKFSVVMLGNATVGVPTGVNITALDQFGNEATSFTDSVTFSSTDGGATLPVAGPLNHGSHGASSVIFLTTGTQTVTVTDGSLNGTSNPVTVDN